jgi:DNA-binding response OmpR family regulator
VLLVEDDPNDVFFMMRASGRLGLRWMLEAAADGEEAVARLERDPGIQYLLLDLKLPRRSGIEVLRWLRAESTQRALRVIMLTSSNQEADVRCVTALGVDRYLIKPIDFKDFVETVREIASIWGIPKES